MVRPINRKNSLTPFRVCVSTMTVLLTVTLVSIASSQDIPRAELRQLITVTADSVATRLRASGRAHLYLSWAVSCDSGAICEPEIESLVRDAFAASAIATVVQPGQRWPTLCDNSDEVKATAPVIVGDTARMNVMSLHSIRGSNRQEGLDHSFLLTRAASKWNVVSYDTMTTQANAVSSQSAWCSWSPEASSAVITDRPDAVTRTAGSTNIPINTEESCPWCRLTSLPRLRLGQPTDHQLPGHGGAVYTDRRGKFFTPNASGTQLLVYDSTGVLAAVVGTVGQQPGEFGSINGVSIDVNGNLFVLDNTARRITVLAPDLSFTRRVQLPLVVDQFWVLRDGRILTVRTPKGEGDNPISIHSATGEVIRSFGAARERDGAACNDCGSPLATIASSGYRLWLAWRGRYQLEEWDLTGRRIAVIENPQPAFGMPSRIPRGLAGGTAAGDSTKPLGLNRIIATGDGSLWVGYTKMDPLAGLIDIVDVIDPVRARLIKSFVGATTTNIVIDGLRAVYRTDEFGFPELRLERYEVDRRRVE